MDRIQAAVIAFHFVIILLALAMVAQHAYLASHGCVVGGHRAAFSARTEILSRIEAECRRDTHGTGFSPAILAFREILSAVGLAGVLNHHQVVLFGDGQNASMSAICPYRCTGTTAATRSPVLRSTSLPEA